MFKLRSTSGPMFFFLLKKWQVRLLNNLPYAHVGLQVASVHQEFHCVYLHEGHLPFLLIYRMSFPDQILHVLRSASHLQPMDVKYVRLLTSVLRGATKLVIGHIVI